jgi:hypothetical protein
MKALFIIPIFALGLSACSPSQLAALGSAEAMACKVGRTTLHKGGVTVAECKALGGLAIAAVPAAPATTP